MDFQARLADETLRYLRRIQGATAPVTPGTVLLPETGTDLSAQAEPGGKFEITLEVKNYQRVHAVAAPALDPFFSPSGTTWYPEADFSPAFSLIAPDEAIKLVVRVSVPAALPAGTYIGALSLRGLGQPVFRLSVRVDDHREAARDSATKRGPAQPPKQARAPRVDRKPVKKKKEKSRKARKS
jgi:hypothetical protein